jgi:hypothetical protein
MKKPTVTEQETVSSNSYYEHGQKILASRRGSNQILLSATL